MCSKEQADDIALYRLCEYGAEKHNADNTILPRFDIMGGEIEKVRTYMARWHPDVPYQMTWPTGRKSTHNEEKI